MKHRDKNHLGYTKDLDEKYKKIFGKKEEEKMAKIGIAAAEAGKRLRAIFSLQIKKLTG